MRNYPISKICNLNKLGNGDEEEDESILKKKGRGRERWAHTFRRNICVSHFNSWDPHI